MSHTPIIIAAEGHTLKTEHTNATKTKLSVLKTEIYGDYYSGATASLVLLFDLVGGFCTSGFNDNSSTGKIL